MKCIGMSSGATSTSCLNSGSEGRRASKRVIKNYVMLAKDTGKSICTIVLTVSGIIAQIFMYEYVKVKTIQHYLFRNI